MRVRKFVDPEPTTSVGAEETYSSSALPIATNLLTENQTNPTRIATFTPHFSVTCYVQDNLYKGKNLQVQVASDSAFSSILWDRTENYSPAVENNQTATVTYSGPALSRGVTYYWRARWYSAGLVGTWSGTATFRIANLSITSVSVDNPLVDRKVDWASGVTDNTTISVRVQSELGADNISRCGLWIRDNSLTVLVDNLALTSRTNLDAENVLFTYTYNPPDNGVAGGYGTRVEVRDNLGSVLGNWENAKFMVTDASVAVNIENVPGHKIRVFGTASLLTGGTYTLQRAIVVDNNLGEENASVSSPNYTVTYSVSSGGTVYVKVVGTGSGAIVDGASPSTSYPYPDFAPEVLSISSSSPIVDRKKDDTSSPAIDSTIITVRVRDNDGENDISRVGLWVRDNKDVVLLDNLSVSIYSTVNENIRDYSYTYNPIDTLPNDNLGMFDTKAEVRDFYGLVRTRGWENKFVVEDLTSSLSFNPVRPYYLWGENTSGRISTIKSGYLAPDNLWFWEKYLGEVRVDNRSGENWWCWYTVKGRANENVPVRARIWGKVNGVPLDGVVNSSYVVNENYLFQLNFRWEENFDFVPDNVVDNQQDWEVTFIHENADSITVRARAGRYLVVDSVDYPTSVSVWDKNNNYFRAYRVFQDRVWVDVFMVSQDLNKVYAYVFRLDDPLYQWGPPNGAMALYKWGPGAEFCAINDDYWTATSDMTAYLKFGDIYKVRLISKTGSVMEWGSLRADANTTRTIIPSLVSPASENNVPIFTEENYSLDYNWELSDNSIRIHFSSTSPVTLNLTVYDIKGNLVENFYQITTDNCEFRVAGDPTKDYVAYLSIPEYGFSVPKLMLSPLMVSPPPVWPGFFNFPVGAMALVGMLFAFICLSFFGPYHSVVGIWLLIMGLAVLRLIGLLNIPAGVFGLLLIAGILWWMIESRRVGR